MIGIHRPLPGAHGNDGSGTAKVRPALAAGYVPDCITVDAIPSCNRSGQITTRCILPNRQNLFVGQLVKMRPFATGLDSVLHLVGFVRQLGVPSQIRDVVVLAVPVIVAAFQPFRTGADKSQKNQPVNRELVVATVLHQSHVIVAGPLNMPFNRVGLWLQHASGTVAVVATQVRAYAAMVADLVANVVGDWSPVLWGGRIVLHLEPPTQVRGATPRGVTSTAGALGCLNYTTDGHMSTTAIGAGLTVHADLLAATDARVWATDDDSRVGPITVEGGLP